MKEVKGLDKTTKWLIRILGIAVAWSIIVGLTMEFQNLILSGWGYDRMKAFIWIPEWGLNALDSMILFLWLIWILPMSLVLVTWYVTSKKGSVGWCFNSSGTLDPPKWKVLVGFGVIVLSDLYVGIETLQEDMSTFTLMKTLGLLVIHALILGFMFLEQKAEAETEEEAE